MGVAVLIPVFSAKSGSSATARKHRSAENPEGAEREVGQGQEAENCNRSCCNVRLEGCLSDPSDWVRKPQSRFARFVVVLSEKRREAAKFLRVLKTKK